MKNAISMVIVLLLGLVGSAEARHESAGVWRQGTPVVVVGQVTSAPHKVAGVVQKKLQIALGPRKSDTYTLHVSDAQMVDLNGEKFATSDLDDKQWVRAEGTIMNDPHRVRVSRLEIIAKDTESVKKTRFYHTGSERGYIEEVTPSRP
jgi:hypothetical protein